jgi:hypothetical protein
MSITAVPISMRLVFAPTAARSGKGEASWRATAPAHDSASGLFKRHLARFLRVAEKIP